jgi:dTDP-4-amino-4,6-dideoxygalactose transaminase
MIFYGLPTVTGNEEKYLKQVFANGRFSGDCQFTLKCQEWLEKKTQSRKVLLTTSCTSALEMAALLLNIAAGDEVIMPSFTFPSTANAFVLRGASIVFVDIRPDTMNMNEALIEPAITNKTKAVIPVHYAGVGCEMNTIADVARKYGLSIVEDSAQGMMAYYGTKPLGTIGDIGCYSFHETKNYQCGEGGCILLNEKRYIERAEMIREKGTDRSKYFRGEIDKYSWKDIGSSLLPSELNAAFLYAQLEMADHINDQRLRIWHSYNERLVGLVTKGRIELPVVPKECRHNAHIFYIKVADIEERTRLIKHLKSNEIHAATHYVPLHSAPAGRLYGRFCGEDRFTTKESERLLRLPIYFQMTEDDVDKVCSAIHIFYK